MKKYTALIAAAAALVVAAPAAANEGRFEARAGMSFGDNQSEEFVAGMAAGYDFDIGSNAFIGAEASLDKIFLDGSGVVLGGTMRAGLKSGSNRYYVNGGYTDLTCDYCGDGFHAGLGAEIGLTETTYGKLEYRHFFFDGTDSNVVAAGIGVRF